MKADSEFKTKKLYVDYLMDLVTNEAITRKIVNMRIDRGMAPERIISRHPTSVHKTHFNHPWSNASFKQMQERKARVHR